jgi:hypothetical protein
MTDTKCKRLMGYAIQITLVLLGCYFLLRGQLHAEYKVEGRPRPKEFVRIGTEVINQVFAKKVHHYTREEYEQKWRFHSIEANLHYEIAKNKCWYLPNIDDRDNARNCFVSFMATIPCPDYRSKAIVALITLLTSYGLYANDEWHTIEHELHLCEYHFEMAEFYRQRLDGPNCCGFDIL